MDTGRSISIACATAFFIAAACSSSGPPDRRHAREEEPAPADAGAAAARISGDWQFAIERGGRSIEGWLHFSYTAGELVGSLKAGDGDPREISKIALKGDKISFRIAGEARSERYEGTLKGASMEGTMTIGPGEREGGGSSGGGSSGGGSGGRRGGGGGGGGRGHGGQSGGSNHSTWRAFRSVAVTPGPPPEPTKPPA